MKRFSALLEHLLFAPQRNAKITYLGQWLTTCPPQDRGWGVAALTGDLDLGRVKGGVVRQLATGILDEELFAQSYDFVGDLAETTALLWPGQPRRNSGDQNEDERNDHGQNHDGQNHEGPGLDDVVRSLQASSKLEAEAHLRVWLDQLDETGRWGLLKLITGGLRVGVSARMLRLALAETYATPVEEIEEIWPLLAPPYDELFAWLEGRGAKPSADGRAVFRPLMLAHPIDDDTTSMISPSEYLAEWKWDGARVQLASAEDGVRLFSRSGDVINDAFPELTVALDWHGTLDGELLAGTLDAVEPFSALQHRLNRKKAGPKLIAERPVFFRAYDLLMDGALDTRPLPIEDRREKLAEVMARLDHPLMDMSEELPFRSQLELEQWREDCRASGLIEGVMLKARGSAYQHGRIKGLWYKWKRDPLTADVVLMYAQRGHGKRSSYYSDYTFGAWIDDGAERRLVPVGKAYSGFTDAELKKLDQFVRQNTTNKFGPVREVAPTMVVEVAFDSIAPSTRHKYGLAMRFPRFAHIRWDKPAAEADTVETLKTWIT
ncbi:MAG: cisplatin damage response ATP-dependent DNA ligase [Alphaproteobacteria bacterium]|nr:cisplatin damage response ATP-dependent DNA ligase [Alphaproteobacteria bacterium]